MAALSSRTQALCLLLFGAAVLRLATSELLLRYVKASARPWVLAAALAMLVLAVWSLVASARQERLPREHVTDEHGHGGPSRAAWLIVLPVVAVLVITPPALGQYTANRRAPVAPVAVDQVFPALPRTDPVRLRVFDFALRAVSRSRASLEGRTVVLTGFVAHPSKDGFLLARLVITCCAADASPIAVAVRTSVPAPAADTWVRVTGRYAGQEASDPNVPILSARSVRTVPAPAEPYD